MNRVAGTLETKAMTSINRDTITSILIEKVVTSIYEKWPTKDLKNLIVVHQNNAKMDVNPNNLEFHQTTTQGSFNICLMCQPPNTHDFNVLDLGFF